MLLSPNKSRKQNTSKEHSRYVIEDALYKRVKFNSSKLITSISHGEYTSLFKSNGLEYAESRTYMYGDDARYIDWKVSSRHNAIYTKHFHEDSNRVVWFMFDVSGSMQIGSPQSLYEIGMETILVLINLALSQKNKVGGLLFSNTVVEYFRPNSKYNATNKIMHAMLAHQYLTGNSNLEYAIYFTRKILTQRSLVIIVSDFLVNDVYSQIDKIARVHDVLLIRTMYNVKSSMPARGMIKVSESESTKKGIISLSKIHMDLELTNIEEERQWAFFCSKNHIPNTTLSNVSSLFPQLLHLFKSLKKR